MPSPGPGEVRLKVDAAGLCHSDLHVMKWSPGTFNWRMPMTLGHETAGTVAALGAGVRGVEEGEPVLVYGPWGCGACTQCARGSENICERLATLPGRGCGLGYDGGLAEYVVVASPRLLVPRGELDAAGAAPLTDAALTPYHALKPQLPRLTPGACVVVIGVGGLGHVAVQLVRELSPARIVALDSGHRRERLHSQVVPTRHSIPPACGLTNSAMRSGHVVRRWCLTRRLRSDGAPRGVGDRIGRPCEHRRAERKYISDRARHRATRMDCRKAELGDAARAA